VRGCSPKSATGNRPPRDRYTNPLERLNREIGRRTDVVGVFPNDWVLLRLATSLVIEQRTMSGSSGGATCLPARWSRSSRSGSIAHTTTAHSRRYSSAGIATRAGGLLARSRPASLGARLLSGDG